MKTARALPALTMALVLAISLSGCQSGSLTVTEEDAGTIQVAHVGDRVTVRLIGNRSTGFTWTRTEPTDEELAGLALQPVEEGSWEFPAGTQVPGASGVWSVPLRSERAGHRGPLLRLRAFLGIGTRRHLQRCLLGARVAC
jgi:predicted secreted protein